MSNLNLRGIWIPIEILTDNSELLNISVTQVSKLISSLKDKNYINVELIYKKNTKQVEMRKIIPKKCFSNFLSKGVWGKFY